LARKPAYGPDYATFRSYLFAQAVCERDRPITHDAAPAGTPLTPEMRGPPSAVFLAGSIPTQLLTTVHRARRVPNAASRP